MARRNYKILKPQEFEPFEPSDADQELGVIGYWFGTAFRCSLVKTAETAWPRLSVYRNPDSPFVHTTIPWEVLMEIKGQLNMDDVVALEVYPATKDTINGTNARHLWLVPEGPRPEWLDFVFTDGKIDIDRALDRIAKESNPRLS